MIGIPSEIQVKKKEYRRILLNQFTKCQYITDSKCVGASVRIELFSEKAHDGNLCVGMFKNVSSKKCMINTKNLSKKIGEQFFSLKSNTNTINSGH